MLKSEELSVKYPETLVLQLRGSFYNAFGESAYALAAISGYKIVATTNTVRCGYPVSSKDKVIKKLRENHINYALYDKEECVAHETFEDNTFLQHVQKGNEVYKEQQEAQETIPKRKDFDGRLPDSSFRIIEKCQIFVAAVYTCTAKAEKEYRMTICKKLQDLACDALHLASAANRIPVTSLERQEVHRRALDTLEKVNDLLPVIRRCKCISPGQEKELMRQFDAIRAGYRYWIESDLKRLNK